MKRKRKRKRKVYNRNFVCKQVFVKKRWPLKVPAKGFHVLCAVFIWKYIPGGQVLFYDDDDYNANDDEAVFFRLYITFY